MSHDWIVQHDNNPKHRATIIANWLNRNGVKRLYWSSFSPDLNPTEHLRDIVERWLKQSQAKTQNELKESLIEVWHGIE